MTQDVIPSVNEMALSEHEEPPEDQLSSSWATDIPIEDEPPIPGDNSIDDHLPFDTVE
jgi:hypothetical protein